MMGFDVMAFWKRAQSDPDWIKKLLLTGLIGFVPFVGGFTINGYGSWAVRRTFRGDDLLPDAIEDNAFVGRMILGLKTTVVAIGWLFVPMIVALVLSGVLAFIGQASGSGVIESLASLIGFLLLLGVYLVGFVFATPAILLTELSGEISEGYNFGKVFAIVKSHWLKIVVSTILGGLIATLLVFAGSLLCLVGLVFTLPLAVLAMGDIRGQLARMLAESGVEFAVANDDTPTPGASGLGTASGEVL